MGLSRTKGMCLCILCVHYNLGQTSSPTKIMKNISGNIWWFEIFTLPLHSQFRNELFRQSGEPPLEGWVSG